VDPAPLLLAFLTLNFVSWHANVRRSSAPLCAQDEAGWKMSFGRDVIAGMLRLPEEDRHGRPKQQSFEQQRKAVLDFSKKWEPHDWTRMLG
jgi:hypothetical protein